MWVIPEELDNFSPKKEKNLGEQKFARLSVSNFRGRINSIVFKLTKPTSYQFLNFKDSKSMLTFPLSTAVVELLAGL